MKAVGFCKIDQLDYTDSLNLMKWVQGRGMEGAHLRVGELQGEDLRWLLAHSTDGVTWGRWSDKAKRWETGHEVFPEISPEISEQNLLELRVFGPKLEYFIWRTDQGFQGRRLEDTQGEQQILKPIDDYRLLLGNILLEPPRNDFSRVGSPSGAEQVVPCALSNNDFRERSWPLRLHLKHYLQQDPETGVVRVVISRLVDLSVKEEDRCHSM